VKNPKGKITEREREKFHYLNGDYKKVLWIRVNLIPFSVEGIRYLYKSCQIDKAIKCYSV